MKKIALIGLRIYGFLFCIFALIEMEIDPAKWKRDYMGLATIIVFIVIIVILLIDNNNGTNATYEKNRNKNRK